MKFKKPKELGLSRPEFKALTMVLDGLEKGKLKEIPVEKAFYMPKVLNMDCGTKGCLLGWAYLISDRKAFDSPGMRKAEAGDPHSWGDEWDSRPALNDLFFPDSVNDEIECSKIKPQHAAEALRNFLTSGFAQWETVLGIEAIVTE